MRPDSDGVQFFDLVEDNWISDHDSASTVAASSGYTAGAITATSTLYNVLPVFALVAALNRTFRGDPNHRHVMQPTDTQRGWSAAPSWAGWYALMAASAAFLLFQP